MHYSISMFSLGNLKHKVINCASPDFATGILLPRFLNSLCKPFSPFFC